jgi:hypothetical protein
MKSTLFVLAFIAIGISSCGPTYVTVHDSPPRQEPLPPPPPQPAEEEVSYQTFYDDLSPYGQWIDYPGYGYVWMPNVDYGFKPYATNGHWVYSEEGWVWASDYNWGWATFHYGRWFLDNAYGWMWVPGYEWAPAWVSWRRSNDYYGWAPLSPGINAGVAISNYNPPNNYWCFVPHQYVTSPTVNNYYVNETKNVTIINNTIIINNNVTNITNNNITNNRINNTTVNNRVRNNVYNAGPDPNEISRETGNTLRPVPITNSNKPGQQLSNGQLALFRPRVQATAPTNTANSNTQQRIAPARVQTLNNIRPINNNTSGGVPINNNAAPTSNERPVNNSSPFTRQNNTPPVSNAPANNTNPTNTPQNRPANNNSSANPVNNSNNQQNNKPNNNPVVNPANNNVPANGNPQPNINRTNNNPPLNRPVNQPPANAKPDVQPVNNNGNQPNNQSNPSFNRNRPSQQQQNPNQAKPQQPNEQARQGFNKPPVNKDAKPKDKPKDKDNKN